VRRHDGSAHGQRGQTLIEALVAFALTSLVLAAGFAAFALTARAKASDDLRGPAADVAANVAAELRAAVEYDPNALANVGNATWTVLPPLPPKGAAPSDGAPVTVSATLASAAGDGASSAPLAVALTFSSATARGTTTLVLQQYAPPPGGVVYLSATPVPVP